VKSLLLNLALFIVVLLVGLEVTFRTVIPACNIAYKALDRQYGILLHDTTGDREGQSTTGRLIMQRVNWRINNCGWRSDKDYYPPSAGRKPVIALIGDSYVAGFQVNYRDHFGSLLEDRLDHGYDVYNLGSGGVPASQYVYAAKYARDRFDPDLYIFLVRDATWMNSIVNYTRDPKVRQIHWVNGHFEDVLPAFTSDKLMRWRKRSAIIRYIVYNANMDPLGATNDAKHRVTLPSDATVPKTYLDAFPLIRPAMEYLLAQLRADLPGKKILFLSNANIENVYDERPQQSQETLPWLEQVCAEYGIYVLDIAPVFAGDWKEHRMPLTFEVDYHWNENGHRLVADAIYDFLTQNHLLDSTAPDSVLLER